MCCSAHVLLVLLGCGDVALQAETTPRIKPAPTITALVVMNAYPNFHAMALWWLEDW